MCKKKMVFSDVRSARFSQLGTKAVKCGEPVPGELNCGPLVAEDFSTQEKYSSETLSWSENILQ